MQAKVRFTGAPEVKRNLGKVEMAMHRKMQRTLDRGGWAFLGEARKRTPVDTGLLRANSEVWALASPMGGVAHIIYYQEYAPYVHERLELKHETGEAKFLENALNNSATRAEAMRIMGAELDVEKSRH